MTKATLLVLIGACQRGDILLAQTAAQTLSGTLHAEALTLAAIRFAEAFRERGLMLPYRDAPSRRGTSGCRVNPLNRFA